MDEWFSRDSLLNLSRYSLKHRPQGQHKTWLSWTRVFVFTRIRVARFLDHSGERFKMTRFRWVDSLVSSGQLKKVDSCKKYAVSKISVFL